LGRGIKLGKVERLLKELRKHPYVLSLTILLPALMLYYRLRYGHWYEE
jgi:hypothetical protein